MPKLFTITKTVVHGSANYGSWAKSGPPTGTQSYHLCMYSLSAFLLEWQNLVVAIAKPQTFMMWPFMEKVC